MMFRQAALSCAVIVTTLIGATHAADFEIPAGDVAALIEAINVANSNGQDSTITLAPGSVYTLTEVDHFSVAPGNLGFGPTGLPTITSPITILGQDAVIERASAGTLPQFRLFFVSEGGSLTLNQLTIRAGSVGGPSQPHSGGGIASFGQIALHDCTIEDCFASSGGGAIFSHHELTMTNTTIRDNMVSNASNHVILIFSGSADFSDSEIRDNAGAGIRVGGQADSNSSLVMNDCLIHGNTGSGTAGGGLFVFSGTAIINDTEITENVSGTGGGGGVHNSGQLTMTDCVINGNTTSGRGGGLVQQGADAVAVLTRCTISDNTAIDLGGGITSDGVLSLIDCQIANNTSSGFGPNELLGGAGGGLFVFSGSADVQGTTLANNVAKNRGGGIQVGAGGSLTIINSTISHNTAMNSTGGGIHHSQDDLIMIHCTVNGNAADAGGGGIFNINGHITMQNSIVANSASGGDIVISSGSFVDGGANIVQDGSAISAPTSMSGDPMLGPIADNGGPTLTHALQPNSIAINAASCLDDVQVDQRGVRRPQGKACDIGAFELEDIVAPIPGDLNGDGVVDVSDLLILLAAWGPCPRSGDCPADLNGDDSVDVSDLLVLLANWG